MSLRLFSSIQTLSSLELRLQVSVVADLGEASNTEGGDSCHHTYSIQAPWALGRELASEKQGPGWLTLIFDRSSKDF